MEKPIRLTIRLFILFFFTVVLFSCEKDNEADDPASRVSGLYMGQYTYSGNQESYIADVTLSRVNDTIVYLKTYITGHGSYSRKVVVRSREEGVYDIIYTYNNQFTNSIFGVITGSNMEYMFNFNEFFKGIKSGE